MAKGSSSARDVTHQLGFLLRLAQTNVWRDLVATFAPLEIKPQQYAALAVLEASPGLTLDALASELRIKAPNLVGMIEDLVSRGLVTRGRLQSDRRISALRLSRAGKPFLQRLKAMDDVHEAALRAMLGSGRLEQMLADLEKLGRFSSGEPTD